MIEKLLGLVKGRKTYFCAAAWLAYKVGVAQSFWPENDLIENALLTGGAFSLRDAIAKVTKPS